MRTHLTMLSLLVASTWLLGTMRSDGVEPGAKPAKALPSALETEADSFASVEKGPTGRPFLAIHYPWQQHTKASIEIRELPTDEVNEWKIKPLYFRHALFNGEASMSVSRCLERAYEGRAAAEFTKNDIEFEILADRNVIGSPAVSVSCRTTYLETGGKTAARTMFPMLEPWSLDKRRLCLDLPEEYFPRACSFRVWMLHGNRIVWTTTVRWPGLVDGQELASAE